MTTPTCSYFAATATGSRETAPCPRQGCGSRVGVNLVVGRPSTAACPSLYRTSDAMPPCMHSRFRMFIGHAPPRIRNARWRGDTPKRGGRGSPRGPACAGQGSPTPCGIGTWRMSRMWRPKSSGRARPRFLSTRWPPSWHYAFPHRSRLCKARRASTLEELEESFPAPTWSSGRYQRKDMEMRTSGKVGRLGAHGFIAHPARHSPGRVHGVTDEASLVSQEPCAPGREAESCEPGTRKRREPTRMPDPASNQDGKRLTALEREFRAHSRIRVHVENWIRRIKTWKVMDGVYPTR